MFRAGTEGWTTMTLFNSAIVEIGAKSRTGSNGIRAPYRAGLMPWVEVVHVPIV